MKLLFCTDCVTLVVPSYADMQVRWCRCSRHAVWWINGAAGLIRVYDRDRFPLDGPLPETYRWGAWLIGVHNSWLLSLLDGRAGIEAALADTPDTYIFKRDQSIAIKVRPGYSGDSAYAELPPDAAAAPELKPVSEADRQQIAEKLGIDPALIQRLE